MKRFLNVGGHSKEHPVPQHYEGWEHHLLDIDPDTKPDIILDAKEMKILPAGQYDAVFCSHTLEHFYFHEVMKVLEGFKHVLKEDGFAEIIVPDLDSVFKAYIDKKIDINDVLYESPAGPISILDVIYGHRKTIAEGDEYFAHKTGFTLKLLLKFIKKAGFKSIIFKAGENYELRAVAFVQEIPSDFNKALFRING